MKKIINIVFPKKLAILFLGICLVFLASHSQQALAQECTNGVPATCRGVIINQDNCFYTDCSATDPDNNCTTTGPPDNGLPADAGLLAICCNEYSNWCPATPIPTSQPTATPCSGCGTQVPPTGTISGPNTLVVGQVGTYTAIVSDSDNNLGDAIIFVEGPPAGTQNWTVANGVGCSDSICAVSVQWQAPAYHPGISNAYTLIINGYDNSGLLCSGNPYASYSSGGNPSQCAPPSNNGAYVVVTVTPPSTPSPIPSSTPSSTPTPSLAPTPPPVAACSSSLCLNGNFIAMGGVLLARPATANNSAPAEDFTERPDFYVTLQNLNPSDPTGIDQLIQEVLIGNSYSWQEVAP